MGRQIFVIGTHPLVFPGIREFQATNSRLLSLVLAVGVMGFPGVFPIASGFPGRIKEFPDTRIGE